MADLSCIETRPGFLQLDDKLLKTKNYIFRVLWSGPETRPSDQKIYNFFKRWGATYIDVRYPDGFRIIFSSYQDQLLKVLFDELIFELSPALMLVKEATPDEIPFLLEQSINFQSAFYELSGPIRVAFWSAFIFAIFAGGVYIGSRLKGRVLK